MRSMIPINLKDLFGDRYRVVVDDSANQEPGAKTDPWYFMIPCRYGSISPFSDELLAFHCAARGIRTRLHREHPEIQVQNWSDDGEAVFLFRPDQFDLVAEYAKPRRKRQISGKERSRLAEMSRKYSPFASISATKTPQNEAISDDSTETMAKAKIGDSGGCSPHFKAGGTA